MSALDAYKIRQDFAILDQVVNDEPLVYLDNACLLYTSDAADEL
mgnify:CR=1 FL=1